MAQQNSTNYALRNRYVFTGQLKMTTGLHVGGEKFTLSASDSPIVLTPEGNPYIPGSSLKGVLRSTIEKIVNSLPTGSNLWSCGLPSKENNDPNSCPTTRMRQISSRRSGMSSEQVAVYFETLRTQLCHTCLLFGSPLAGSRILVNDLYLVDNELSGAIQVRDGVAIDRDSETAKTGAKYDFEVVPATNIFDLCLTLENASAQDLQLISIGLSEFVHGFASIGGKRSRGLGACILTDLHIEYLDLENGSEQERRKRLQRFLLKRELASDKPFEAFFEDHINKIFAPPSESTAQ